MTTKFLVKRSTVAAKVPATTDLSSGELAANIPDGKLFLKQTLSGTDTIVEIGAVRSVAGRTGNVILTAADSSYSGRTVAARLNDVINVKDYGAKGDGVTDDSTAIIAAATALTASNGTLYFPAGDYLINSRIGLPANIDVTIMGAGKFTTAILVNNTSGGFYYDGGSTTGSNYSCHFGIYDLSIQSNLTGVSNGDAVYARWTSGSNNASTPHFDMCNVVVRNKGASANDYFANGLHIINSATSKITDCTFNQLGADCTHIFVDNDNTIATYQFYVHNCDITHGTTGIKIRGWIEDVNITGSPINGQTIGIDWDASGVGTVATVPNLHVQPGTVMNNKQYNIKTNCVDNVFLIGVDCYHGVGSGTDVNGGNILIQTCSRLGIFNCKLQSPRPSGVTSENLISLYSVNYFNISNNIFQDVLNSHILIASGCANGLISSNEVYGSSSNSQFVLAQTGNVADSGINITNNNIRGAMSQIVLNVGSGGLNIMNNTGPSAITGYVVSGSTVPTTPCRILNNYPPQNTAVTGATPSVIQVPDGRLYISNTAATTITNFTGGYEGMPLEIYFANANTTVAHNGNIFLQGSVAATFAAGTFLRLKYYGGTWMETSRRT